MFADSVQEAARRASLSISDALLLAASFAAALVSFCSSLKLSPPWMTRHRGDKRTPCTAGNICTVCLGEISIDGKLRKLPECGHCFHTECIETWLGYRRTCPLCRMAVSRGSGDRKLRACAGWLLRLLMARVCKWMDENFDSNLAFLFCHDSETLLS